MTDDDELVEILARAYRPETFDLPRINLNRAAYDDAYARARSALARIRRPLEARGIGVAAEWHGAKAREAMRDSHNTPHLEGAAVHLKRADNHLTCEMNLTVLARQHAAGEDGK